MSKARAKRTHPPPDPPAGADSPTPETVAGAKPRPRLSIGERMRAKAAQRDIDPDGASLGKSEETGIQCPSCGSCWHRVYKTARMCRKIIRYRECERCARRFTTTEVAGDVPT